MRYFIIEHPVRGCFCDIDYGMRPGQPRPHFIQAPRNHREVNRFFNLSAVQRTLEKFPDKLRSESYVLLSNDSEWVEVEV